MTSSTLRRINYYAFPAFFVVAGTLHFFWSDFYADKLPSFVPVRRELVLVAGVFEVMAAILSLFPPMRRWASLGIMTFLLTVIPINVAHMIFSNNTSAPWFLGLRLIFLALLAVWAFLQTRF